MSFGQGGPGWGPGGQGQQPSTPDWAALAEDAAAARARRRRWLLIGGGALATAAVAAMVAIAVVTQSGDGQAARTTAGGPSGDTSTSAEPSPTFSDVKPPPPPDPRDFISDPAKDTAPLTPKTLFPDATMSLDGRTYTRGATDSTAECGASAAGNLSTLLRDNGCEQLLRATFTRDNIAVTIGVAVFESEEDALNTADKAKGNVKALPGAGVPQFCRGVVCRPTSYAIGRYAYFTVAGYTDDERVTKDETKARTAGEDASSYAYQRIMQRGRTQASAAATAAAG